MFPSFIHIFFHFFSLNFSLRQFFVKKIYYILNFVRLPFCRLLLVVRQVTSTEIDCVDGLIGVADT